VSAVDARVGSVLDDRYRIEAPISEGGMGAVYRGVDVRGGRPVAVKVIRAELVAEPHLHERLIREARVVGSLAHPHIVQTFDFGTGPDGSPYLVMELLSGEPLSAVLRGGRQLPMAQAMTFVAQMLDALAIAHGAGVVHRDLKPANVFVARGPNGSEAIKVLDFGIAKLMDSEPYRRLTATGQILGTPTWMAPEQALGEAADATVDVYAAGLIAYRALAGRMPWDAESKTELLVAIQVEPARPLTDFVPDLDPALDAVIRRCLAKFPQERFADAGAMREALSPWLPSRPAPTISGGAPTLVERAHVEAAPKDVPVTRHAAPGPVAAPVRRGSGTMLAVLVAIGLGALMVVPALFVMVSTFFEDAARERTPEASECLIVPLIDSLNGLYPSFAEPLDSMEPGEAAIAACLAQPHEPELPGEFRIHAQLDVQSTGTIDGVRITDLGPLPEDHRGCLAGAIRQFRLEPPINGTGGTLGVGFIMLCL